MQSIAPEQVINATAFTNFRFNITLLPLIKDAFHLSPAGPPVDRISI